MNDLFAAVEQWRVSVWMREDDYAYFLALILHAFGMADLVGGAVLTCLMACQIETMRKPARLRAFIPVLWLGTGAASISGVLLLLAYPAKALTNPVFGVKFACLLAGALLLRNLVREPRASLPPGQPAPPPRRVMAALTLLTWLGAVAAGKLLLHTYTILTVT